MPSPFPGMDPFIEACDLWGDFHDKLIGEIERETSRRLPLRYVARVRKRAGSAGWLEYDRKRQVFLEGHANLVEIDLLRGGRRRAMEAPWPDSPYYVLAMRKSAAPACQVWPAHAAQPLPEIAIPLAPPDELAFLP